MKILAAAYGIACYGVFLGAFLYAIGFVGDFVVPKTVDNGPAASLAEAFAWDAALLAIFAVQHSLMARPAFKRWWTRIVPELIERSTYVAFASVALVLLFWQWRPIAAVVWSVASPPLVIAIDAVFWIGWLAVLASTFLINHFELFGLRQVWLNLAGRRTPAPEFRTPLFYRLVRHPIYLGFILAFWATPTMTAGHLFFAAGTTLYIVIAIQFEEHDLIAFFGDAYRTYRKRVRMLVPLPRRR